MESRHSEDNAIPIEEIPVCPRCITPIDRSAYYCQHCGEATSPLTPYLPVVSIRFNYSIFGEMWNKIWQPGGASLLKKMGYLIFIGFWVWPLFLALPWAFSSKSKTPQENREPS